MGETRVPLLLHSLAEFRDVIFECLDTIDASRVVEVGGEDGTFTRELVSWASRVDGRTVVCVDPTPAEALRTLASRTPTLELVEALSIPAVSDLEADAYFLDGDHNYYTVARELELIEKAAARSTRPMVVFLHDVGWPCARRDQYYDPSSLPQDAVHEHVWDQGVVPWSPTPVEGGFRGEGAFAAAAMEGGPRNGVLTAIEDFLKDRPNLRLAVVPAIFGLGVLYDSSAPFGEPLRDALAFWDQNPLLRRLEENRLELYLRVIELQDEMAQLVGRVSELERSHHMVGEAHRLLQREYDELQKEHAGALQREREPLLVIRDLKVENRALWRRVEEAERELQEATRDRDTALEQATEDPSRRLQAWGRRLEASLRRRLAR